MSCVWKFICEAPVENKKMVSKWLQNKTLFLLQFVVIPKCKCFKLLTTNSININGCLLWHCATMVQMAQLLIICTKSSSNPIYVYLNFNQNIIMNRMSIQQYEQISLFVSGTNWNINCKKGAKYNHLGETSAKPRENQEIMPHPGPNLL